MGAGCSAGRTIAVSKVSPSASPSVVSSRTGTASRASHASTTEEEDLANVDTAVTRLMTLLHANALRSLLSDPAGKAAFSAFLERESSQNNLAFYDAVCGLLAGGGLIDASEIIKKYVMEGSDEQVNLTHNNRLQVEKMLVAVPGQAATTTARESPPPSSSSPASSSSLPEVPSLPSNSSEVTLPHTTPPVVAATSAAADAASSRTALAHAAEEILRLMAFDSMPRFLRSREYAALTAEAEQNSPLALELQSAVAALPSDDSAAPTTTAAMTTTTTAAAAATAAVVVATTPSLSSAASVPTMEGLLLLSSSWLRRFIGLANILPCCVTVADMELPSFPLIFVNPKFLSVTGFTFAEATGRNCRFLQGKDTDPAVVARIREALSDSKELRCTLTNYKKDGSAFQNMLALVPVFQRGSRKARFFVGIQFEVTPDISPSLLLQLDSIIALLPRKI